MTPEQLTDASQELINNSARLATELKNPSLLPVHILAVGINDPFCENFFLALNIPLGQLSPLVETELHKLPSMVGGQLTVDYSTEEFLRLCQQEAELRGDSYISLEHFMLAWAQTKNLPKPILDFWKSHGFTPEAIQGHMNSLRKGKAVKEKNVEQQYQVLERYCQDITKQAKEGKLDPVIGRHEEIRRVIQILSRRTKNNPVLIGEPGVGKTAIVEGIAQTNYQ